MSKKKVKYVFEPEVTEEQWLDLTNNDYSGVNDGAIWRSMPTPEEFNTPDRKKLLLVAYLLRQLSDQLTHPIFVEAIEAGEKCADGIITADEMWDMEGRVAKFYDSRRFRPQAAADAANCAHRYLYEQNETSEMVVWAAASRAVRLAKARGKKAEQIRREAQDAMKMLNRRLIYEVHGNPFRPVKFADAWRTDTVVSLARTMYDSRDLSAMPILADALQDAGCDNDAILSHCRDSNQLHIRGCWVVDHVLGMAYSL